LLAVGRHLDRPSVMAEGMRRIRSRCCARAVNGTTSQSVSNASNMEVAQKSRSNGSPMPLPAP
jgi:hypothetical protein